MDDFCWGGTKLFRVSVIDQVKRTFDVKSEESDVFKYVGLDIKQQSDGIWVGQDNYVQSLKVIPTVDAQDKERMMSNSQVTEVRSAIGQLNWLATHTRPDLCFDVSDLSSFL